MLLTEVDDHCEASLLHSSPANFPKDDENFKNKAFMCYQGRNHHMQGDKCMHKCMKRKLSTDHNVEQNHKGNNRTPKETKREVNKRQIDQNSDESKYPKHETKTLSN